MQLAQTQEIKIMNESVRFSCFFNLSRDSIHEFEWNVFRSDDPFDTVSNGYAISAVMTLYLLLGLPWSSVVIFIILKKRLIDQPAFMLMLNLAVTNFLAYIFIMPLNIVTGITGEYMFGPSDTVRCRVCQTGAAIILFPLVFQHTLTLMAVDRFIYLKKPLTYHLIVTPRRMFAAIAGVWVLCFLLILPPLFGFGQIGFSYTVATCVVYFDQVTDIAPNYYYVLLILGEMILPFSILCVMYVWIILITRKFLMAKLSKMLAIKGHDEKSRSDIFKKHGRDQLRLVQVFMGIFTSSIITWLPLVPLVIAVAALEPGSVPPVGYSVRYLVYMSSTVIHPMLQAFLNHEIRFTIEDLFTKLCKI